MLSQPEFPSFADDVVLFCHVTSHVESDPYQGLLQEKGGRGFPYLAFLDDKGDVIAAHDGPRTLEAFRSTAGTVREYRDLLEKAESGDPEAKTALFFCRIDLGQFTLDEAKSEARKLKKLTDEQKSRLEASLLNLDVRENFVDPAANTSQAAKLGEKWYQLARKGLEPSRPFERQAFWRLIDFYGEKKNNKAARQLAAEALAGESE